jgi:hypothetical protein
LYAPKVKVILQSEALNIDSLFKDRNITDNVTQAKNLVSKYFLLADQILDDSFFKIYMRDFEPVSSQEMV